MSDASNVPESGTRREIVTYCVLVLYLAALSLGFDQAAQPWFPIFSTPPGILLRRLLDGWMVVGAFIAVTLGTAQLLSSRRWYFRYPLLIYHGVGLWTIVCFFMIQGHLPWVWDVATMIGGLVMLNFQPMDMLLSFGRQVAASLVVAIAFLYLLDRTGKRFARLRRRLVSPMFGLFLYAAGATVFLLPNFSENIGDAPIFSRIPVMALSWHIRSNWIFRGVRDKPLDLACASEGTARHIVFIMDESVGGKYLSLNGYPRPTTPFLESSRDRLFTYGSASSSANLSMTSNLIFLSGLRLSQLPDNSQASLRQASIFGYARQAGRETYYIDAQDASRGNLVLPRDLADFRLVIPEPLPIYERDMKAISLLRKCIADSERPTFTFLLKSGCHFDYSSKFPPDGTFDGLEGLGGVPETYHKSVRWNVDHFFSELIASLEGFDVLVLYTSDHGQSFDGSVSAPHGVTKNPPRDQADVPLIVWPLSESAGSAFEKAGGFRPDQMGRTSHFQLFPTLLELMGYDRNEVASRFGAGLFDAPPSLPRVFMSGALFDEFGNGSAETFFNTFDAPESAASPQHN
jgi:lipid A ethanolaminephosphotransferase